MRSPGAASETGDHRARGAGRGKSALRSATLLTGKKTAMGNSKKSARNYGPARATC
jgi:hypothetical protein